jgi:hypothetical protein
MDLDDIFNECANDEKYRVAQQSHEAISKSANNMIKNIEAEYTGKPIEDSQYLAHVDRHTEKKEIVTQLTMLTKQLNALKNPKGMKGSVNKREKNTSIISQKRETLRKQIKVLKFKLDEIQAEEGLDNKDTSKDKTPSMWNNDNPY